MPASYMGGFTHEPQCPTSLFWLPQSSPCRMNLARCATASNRSGAATIQALSKRGKFQAFSSRLRICCVVATAGGTRGFGALGPALPKPVNPTAPSSLSPTPTPRQLLTLMAEPVATPVAKQTVASCERLAALRKAMKAADGGKGVHAYLVPTEDPHMSEYSPDCFKRREWVSRFTGTAGWAVVTAEEALLWTDGRYFLQASQELGKEWTLMKAGMPGFPDMEDWLAMNLPPKGRVGIDPYCHTVDSFRRLTRLTQDAGKVVVPLLEDGNLVDKAWGADRPAAPTVPLRVHDIKWAGEGVSEKVARMKTVLTTAKADVLLVSMLDEVMWLMNVRGRDIACNPVALSYALVRREGPAALYVDPAKVTPAVALQLKEAGVQVLPYDAFLGDVKLEAEAGKIICMDPAKLSYAAYQVAKQGVAASDAEQAEHTDGSGPPAKRAKTEAPKNRFVEQASPVTAAKAVKNESELEGMREAHLRDAVALAKFLSGIEAQVGSGKTLTEVEVDLQLTGLRAAQEGFLEPSFATIAGAGPNGAIIHYRAQPETCRTVDATTMLLLDSGGQYECGTTDITRTMHFGTPTQHQRRCYTRVLQGHILLDTAVFPEGTPGATLDVLARVPLWQDGLNYRHGTGHGVGAALNVHEGPIAISSRFHITTPLAPKMVVSNEPGYYEDGGFGVRIENLVEVVEKNTPFRFGGVSSFGFQALTLVPIQAKLMDLTMLSTSDVQWVDSYHARVWESVSPRLAQEPVALEWLKKNTRPLDEQLGA